MLDAAATFSTSVICFYQVHEKVAACLQVWTNKLGCIKEVTFVSAAASGQ